MSNLSGTILGRCGSRRNRPARRFPILSYHAIVDDDRQQLPPESSSFHAVSAKSFREQLDILTSEGWTVVPPQALCQPSLPPRCVLITFDDGHASDLIAAAELRRRTLPATFFVTWSRLGCAGFLTPLQVRELACDGFRIGSHGLSHVPLAELALPEARHQLTGSRERLEGLLGGPVDVVAVPFGSYNRPVIDGAIAAGYRSLMTSDFTLAVAGSYVLARLTVHSRTTLRDFRSLLAGSVVGIARQRLANSLAVRIIKLRSFTGRIHRDQPHQPHHGSPG
jgi:peptidoglycan/xylan/chitin deacetylase (PgdA/CDA1 family)